MTVFDTEDGVSVAVERAVVTGDDSSDLYNGAGDPTNEYNDTDGDANGTAYIKTNLPSVDHAEVSIAVNDPALSASAVGVVVADAQPAEASDFFQADAFVDGTIIFTLVDEDGSGEISDDTDISNVEFTVTAYNT